MQIEDETVPGGPSRGRVVMLVDNDVVRDSRVQKAAQSMADSGWEVHLLGSARGKRRRSWRIGGARVRLLPVQHVLLRDRHGVLRATLRRPLAYGHPKVADYRRRLVQSRRADLAAARLDRNSRGPARKVWLLGRGSRRSSSRGGWRCGYGRPSRSPRPASTRARRWSGSRSASG
ncbi:hypothetical protein ACFQY7_44685 [Actinomadura luteofluorescens]|uniref:hypothetical protein n=1 Tax=Actinomadura luteofluorescens TaxID=46163 RepID=UPI00363D3E53